MLGFSGFAFAGWLFDAFVTNEKTSCNNGNGVTCSNLGRMYGEGHHSLIKQDYLKAVKYYQKACGLGDGDGCNNLGVMYRTGKDVRQSNSKALEYYGKGCDLQSSVACKNYAELNK